MMQEKKRNEEETLDLILKIWIVFIVGLHLLGFIDESYFPGFRSEPLDKQEILWKAQQVIFFGMMCLGFLIDIIQMRLTKDKAYQFLLLSLVMGSLSGYLSAYQYKFIAVIFRGG
jgi:hypothetical protein|tara:strand:+ start:226 stop:570 length:345 start_codon:yes stop_codon:yes gene_type:complete